VVLRKASSKGKSGTRKLKLKKETLKDLDARGKRVKGGGVVLSAARVCAGRPAGQDGGTGTGGQTLGLNCVSPTLGGQGLIKP
jgi:hypothetical protein